MKSILKNSVLGSHVIKDYLLFTPNLLASFEEFITNELYLLFSVKKLMRLKALVILFLTSLVGISQVQSLSDVSSQTEEMTIDFPTIQRSADSIYQQWDTLYGDSLLAPGEKQYRRWEYFMSKRYFSNDGTFSSSSEMKSQLEEYFNFTYCSQGPANNSWYSVGPNPGYQQMRQAIGIVNCIGMLPSDTNTIYVGAGQMGGMYKTTNHGQTWTNVTDGLNLAGLGIGAVIVHPVNANIVIAGTGTQSIGDRGIYKSYGIIRSTNAGSTWAIIDEGVDAVTGNTIKIPSVAQFRFLPNNPNTIYAITAKQIWKSTDTGVSWSMIFETTKDEKLSDIEITRVPPYHIYVSTDYAIGVVNASLTDMANIYCSTDNGVTFNDVTPSQVKLRPAGSCAALTAVKVIELDVTTLDNNHMYCFYVTTHNGNLLCKNSCVLLKSGDGGLTWSTVFDNLVPGKAPGNLQKSALGNWNVRHKFELSDVNSNTFYIGGDIVMKSTNNGVGWRNASKYTPNFTSTKYSSHGDIRQIMNLGAHPITGKDFLFIANDGGLGKTINGAHQEQGGPYEWFNLNGLGLQITEFFGATKIPGNELYVGGAIHNGVGTKTQTGWYPFNRGTDDGWFESHPFYKDTIFTNNNELPLMLSIDGSGGIIYHNTNNNPSGKGYLASKLHINPGNPEEVYFCGQNNIYRFKNSTRKWDILHNNPLTRPDGKKVNHYASVIKAAPSEPNTLYAAYEQPYRDKSWQEHKFFKSFDGGATWANITDSLPALKWMFISDLVIDPKNPNRVWVSGAGYRKNGDWRVFYSGDGGSSWLDISQNGEGLPIFPINCMVYQNGSDDVIYVGTDVGVYYWDKNLNGWKCFNKELPQAVITQLHIDYCDNKLLAATFGRGLWEAPLLLGTKPFEISQNTVWPSGETQYIQTNLIVKNGVTLTVKGKAEFGSSASLIIKPGAKVILDGGELTNMPYCGINWVGVSVEGQSNQPQNAQKQGVIEIKNGGMISNARTAITNARFDQNGMVWGTTGGIITANQAIFLNNKRDIQFMPYHRFNSNGVEISYQAQFTECDFIKDSDYPQDNIATDAVSMWQVNGVMFNGCKFENLNNPNTHKTNGIKSVESQFIVDRYSTLTNPNNTRTSFEGYLYAIHGINVCRADRYTAISHSDFSNNYFGIYLANHANAKVVYNNFNIPGALQTGSNPAPYGIYMDKSTGYTIQENNLVNETGIEGIGKSVGIVLNENGPVANMVRKNQFNGLTVGTEAIGSNMSSTKKVGLQYRCNNFGEQLDNLYDILVFKGVGNVDQGIATNQGKNASVPVDLANNLHSRLSTDIKNEQGLVSFNYYHLTPIGNDPRFDPLNPSNINSIPINLNGEYANVCLNEVDFNNSGPEDPEGEVFSALKNSDEALSQKRELYQQLINGGSSSELEAQILLAGQPEYQELYLELMSIAPYVEEGQLINLINNIGFSELALRNVLIANPHGSRNPEVMEALYTRTPAVSQQTINDVLNVQATITSKDVLEAEISDLSQKISTAISGLQYYYIANTDNSNDLENLFKSRKEAENVALLANWYWMQGKVNNLAGLFNTVDMTWWAEKDISYIQEMSSIYEALTGAIQNEESIDALSEQTLNDLLSRYNLTRDLRVWQFLHGLLAPYDMEDKSYSEPVYFPEQSMGKREINEDRPIQYNSGFWIYPNPAKEYVELHWDWFQNNQDENFNVRILSLDGKVVLTGQEDDVRNNVMLLPTKQLKTGIYIIEVFNNNGEVLYHEKLSVL